MHKVIIVGHGEGKFMTSRPKWCYNRRTMSSRTRTSAFLYALCRVWP